MLRDRVPPRNTWVRMNIREEPFQSLGREVGMTCFFHKDFTETKPEDLSPPPPLRGGWDSQRLVDRVGVCAQIQGSRVGVAWPFDPTCGLSLLCLHHRFTVADSSLRCALNCVLGAGHPKDVCKNLW